MRWALGCLAAAVAVAILDATVVSAQTDPAAQTDTSLARAADVITAEAIARHMGVIAHDSMAGRATPSRGLSQTAQYVARQFQTFGLTPGAEAGTWVQEYPIASSAMALDYTASRLYCTASRNENRNGNDTGSGSADRGTGDPAASVTYASGAYIAVDTALESDAFRLRTDEAVVAITGRQTPTTIARADVHGRVVLYAPAPGEDSVTEQQVLQTLYADNRVLVLRRQDSATFARRQQAAASRSIAVIDQDHPSDAPRELQHWAAYVRSEVLGPCLERAGAELAQWQSDTLPKTRELPGLVIWSVVRPAKVTEQSVIAMNVVGIIPGTGGASAANDPGRPDRGAAPRAAALVITAHMDHADPGRDRADPAGANDNASGVAVLLELAKAFGQLEPRARPRCPIVFLATSGEDRLAGATFWLNTNATARPGETGRVMANINLDMLGRPAGDSVWMDGLHEVDWPVRLDWLAALHPELRLTVVDGGSIVQPLSDHFVFVRSAIPSLYVHDDTHDSPVFAAGAGAGAGAGAALEPARTARIAKLVFHLVSTLATSPRQPRWTAEGRRQRLAMFDQP